MRSYNDNTVARGAIDNSRPIGVLIITTILFLIALGPFLSLQKVTTNLLIPLLFFIALTRDLRTFGGNKREFLLIVLIVLTSVTSIFNYVNYDLLLKGYIRLIGVVLVCFIPIALNKKQDYSNYFHVGYILATLTLILIMYLEGNFTFSNFATKVDFRDRFLINANAYSYYTFFANFSLFYLYLRYKTKLLKILLVLFPILFLMIAFVTQSRSGLLLIVLINICFWLFVNKTAHPTKFQKLLRSVGIAVIFVFVSMQFLKVYQTSRIKNRVDVAVQRVDARELLIVDSFDAFAQHPVLGVGLDQLPYYTRIRQFSHNSFIEIIAEQGILGGILLLLLYGIPLKQCWSMLRRDPNNIFLRLNLLFFICFYLFNNFYPFYKFAFSMLYFFLVISMQYQWAAKEKILVEQIEFPLRSPEEEPDPDTLSEGDDSGPTPEGPNPKARTAGQETEPDQDQPNSEEQE